MTIQPVGSKDLLSTYEDFIRKRLNDVAKANGYDSIDTACAYASEVNPYQVQSQAFVAWRGNVWNYYYGLLQQVNAGTAPTPSLADIATNFPIFTG
jgi:hypothetical protein